VSWRAVHFPLSSRTLKNSSWGAVTPWGRCEALPQEASRQPRPPQEPGQCSTVNPQHQMLQGCRVP
jgi:hypothetical protein